MSHWHVRKRARRYQPGDTHRFYKSARQESRPTSQPELLDSDRRTFVQALDAADFEVTDWEAGFIESCLKFRSYTDKVRAQIDRLIGKYGHRVKWKDAPTPKAPVRSQTRVAYVPDDAQKLLSPGS